MLLVAVAQSSSDDSAIRFVLQVLCMTLCLSIMGPIGQNQARRCFVHFFRWRHRGEVCRLRLHIVYARILVNVALVLYSSLIS